MPLTPLSRMSGPSPQGPSPARTGPRRTTGAHRRDLHPLCESLEHRSLLSGVGRVPASFLLTPIPDGAPLAEHIHPHLTILIDGQQQTIPAQIGIQANGNLPLHTHDASGRIHVESTRELPFRLRDFFTIWGQKFTSRDLLGHVANAKHRITMTVDGRPSRAFGSLLLQDGQDIVLRYDTIAGRHPGR